MLLFYETLVVIIIYSIVNPQYLSKIIIFQMKVCERSLSCHTSGFIMSFF